MRDPDVQRIISELRAEAEIDFFDISFIAESLREELDLRGQEQIRCCTLAVINSLMALGVYPGDYDYATVVSFWSGQPDELLKRIESEWIAMGTTPTSAEPICWFGLRPAEVA